MTTPLPETSAPPAAVVPVTVTPRPVSRSKRLAVGYAAAGALTSTLLSVHTLALIVGAHKLTTVGAVGVGVGLAAAGALLGAWVALLSRGGLREAARSDWWPALLLSVWGLSVAGGTLGLPFGIKYGFIGSFAGGAIALSAYTAAWRWLIRPRLRSAGDDVPAE